MWVCLSAKPSFLDSRLLLALGALVVTLLVAAVIFTYLDRWRKRELNETFTTHDQLASFQVLYERGELGQEEYDRIRRELVGGKKKDEPKPPAPESAGPSGDPG